METSAQEIVLKIGNVINERHFGGQSLHSPVLKVQLHVYDFCIICFALLRDVICLALGPKQGPSGPLQTLPCL